MVDFDQISTALQTVSPDLRQFTHDVIVMQLEGDRFENDPDDSGGATKDGISLRFAESEGLIFDLNDDGRVDVQDIRRMTADIATSALLYFFFVKPGFGHLPSCAWKPMLDDAINAGVGKSVHLLQRTLNQFGALIDEDGLFGALTNKAAMVVIDRIGAAAFVNAFCDVRDADYENIVRNIPRDSKFLKGWKARSDSYRIQE